MTYLQASTSVAVTAELKDAQGNTVGSVTTGLTLSKIAVNPDTGRNQSYKLAQNFDPGSTGSFTLQVDYSDGTSSWVGTLGCEVVGSGGVSSVTVICSQSTIGA